MPTLIKQTSVLTWKIVSVLHKMLIERERLKVVKFTTVCLDYLVLTYITDGSAGVKSQPYMACSVTEKKVSW